MIGTDIVGENQGQVGRERCVKTKGGGYLKEKNKN
jgi:hypothetical protein